MRLKVINSNSSGNAYVLENETQALLIEAGVPFSKIEKAIDHKLLKINACLITHEHKDHCKSISHVQASGIPVIASRGTFEAIGTPRELMDIVLAHGQKYRTPSGWIISAFDVKHDAAEPLGFIIEHKDCGRGLFITDTYILKHRFNYEFDFIIIEANYCKTLREKQGGNRFVEYRRLSSHMSLQTVILTLSKLNLNRCKNIILIHLSDNFTDEDRFKTDVEGRFGIPTTIARPGVEINLSREPF